LGIDSVEAIKGSVASCDVLIAIIGRHWLVTSGEQGRRRLENPEDLCAVRLKESKVLPKHVTQFRVLMRVAEKRLEPQLCRIAGSGFGMRFSSRVLSIVTLPLSDSTVVTLFSRSSSWIEPLHIAVDWICPPRPVFAEWEGSFRRNPVLPLAQAPQSTPALSSCTPSAHHRARDRDLQTPAFLNSPKATMAYCYSPNLERREVEAPASGGSHNSGKRRLLADVLPSTQGTCYHPARAEILNITCKSLGYWRL
jgi:hypothetical protein